MQHQDMGKTSRSQGKDQYPTKGGLRGNTSKTRPTTERRGGAKPRVVPGVMTLQPGSQVWSTSTPTKELFTTREASFCTCPTGQQGTIVIFY
ncbi:hypothetical protein ACOMHN_027542 [Nucella lapillus]